nr:hypothetical protein [Tanacetum cinerariifolium]
MHNNIMAAGSRDRLLMIATGRYAQWQSSFLIYIDTRPNGDALRKCILKGPYTPSTVIIPVLPATDNAPVVPDRTTVETILNMSLGNKVHYESKKEAIHLILTGIGDEIYSTVYACKTAHEIWEAIERLQQGESLNIQDVKTNLFWEFGNSLLTMVKQWSHTTQAKNANPLALVAAAQSYPDPYYQAPNSHKLYAPTSKASPPTRYHATTRQKGKEIAKPITPPSESASEEDSDPKKAQKDKDMQKNMALITRYLKNLYKPTNNNLRTSLNSKNKNVDTTLRYKNHNQNGQFRNQRTMNVAGARETVGSQVVQQTGIQCFNCVPLQAEQSDWLADTDEEIDEQELEAHYSFIAKVQEVDSNVIPDSPDMCDNDIQTDQNVVECDDERVVLANLIENLKLDVDENKKIQKQLKKSNTSLAHELNECKSILAETSKTLGESNSIRDSCLIAIQNKQSEFERGTEFLNKTLHTFFKKEGYEHQTYTPQKPKHNSIVERQNRTLVEAARTMLSAPKLPLFFWAEANAIACYTQNRSIIILTHEKMAYHIIDDKKPLIKYLHIFCCTCYLTRDGENLDKIKEKRDPCILVGYSTQSKGYCVYNKRTKLIVKSIHLRFDEIKEMSETCNSSITTRVGSSFGPLYDEFFNACASSVNKSFSTIDKSKQQDTPPTTNNTTSTEPTTPMTNIHAEENNNNQAEDTQVQQAKFISPFCKYAFLQSTTRFGILMDKDHPLTQVCGNPSKPVQTRRQLATDPEMCMFTLTVSTIEPKTIQEAMANSACIEAIQEELH